jgi:hypothetical protein
VAALERLCAELLPSYDSAAESMCASPISYVTYDVGGGAYGYDMRIFGYMWDPIEDPVNHYFDPDYNSDADTVFTNIHVTASTKTPKFCMGCAGPGEALTADNLINYVEYYEKLINEEQSKILIYDGEFDARDGAYTQDYWVRNMTFTDEETFWNTPRSIYYLPDGEGGYRVGGQYRETSLFTYLTVPKAGHFVPNVQLNNYFGAYAFFADYVNNQKLTCQGETEESCSAEAAMCSAMNDCWNLGVCGEQNPGQCACRSNSWKGADCSL